MNLPSVRGERWNLMFLGAPWIFLFLQALPHTAALKSFDLVWLIVVSAWIFVCGKPLSLLRSPLVVAMVSLVLIALLSAVSGPYREVSLEATRKEFLAPLLVFFIVISVSDASRGLLLVASAVVAGFALRTALILPEWSMIDLPQRLESVWVKGYAMDAVLFLPLVLASLVALAQRRWVRGILVLLLVIAFVIVIEYGSRTALAALMLGMLPVPLLLGRWRSGLFALVTAAGIFVAMLWVSPPMQTHYQVVFNADSYTGTHGMSDRYPIWYGMRQIVAERPLLGYGPGWKKLAVVAREEGYLARWKTGGEMDLATATYFDQSPGTVNPHNLALEVLFEVGALGLVATVAIWGIVAWNVFQAWRLRRNSWIYAWLTAGGTAFLIAYGLMNFSNGLWPLPGPIAGVLAVVELSRRARLQEFHVTMMD